MRSKVFVYVIRMRETSAELLVFASLDEPGYEAPKGSVEPGESLEEAVHREVYEESGLEGLRIIKPLGKTWWGDEKQHFFLAEAPANVADVFEYQVTGKGIDRGFQYQYRWLEIERTLEEKLVQGCDRFVGELIAAVDVQMSWREI
jgi:8-oxo-dGTP pyrophosphatase MutT (NUDIX family)